MRNAALSQEFEAFKRRSADTAGDRDSELQHKNAAIAGLENVLQDMEGELKSVRAKVIGWLDIGVGVGYHEGQMLGCKGYTCILCV